MNPESKFWNQLKERLPNSWHAVRIENSSSRGTPDVNVCTDTGVELWLELKHGKANIRPEQRVFGIKRSKVGGLVLVLCQSGSWISVWKYPFDTETIKEGAKVYFRIISVPLFTVPMYNLIPELRDLCLKYS